MGISSLTLFLLGMFLAYGANSLELLANYKFWKSASDKLTYDYSGNSRHTSLYYDYLMTDRGLSTNIKFSLSLMSYSFPVLNEYVISYWALNRSDSGLIAFNINYNGGYFIFQYSFNTDSSIFRIYNNTNTNFAKSTTSTSSFSGWNLHTLRLHIESTTPNRLHFNVFRNLSPLYSDFFDTVTSLQLTFIRLWADQVNSNSSIIIYEMWIYKVLGNILDQSSLISSSSSCGCIYNCPTSPSTVCLPDYERNMNKLGQQCTNCSTNLSCDANMNCIQKHKSGCQYGLYDLETYECLFYCPNNSCICSAVITGEFDNIAAFSCSCVVGYKKISNHPPACISTRCLSYHKEGYIYICDDAEPGYLLDHLGIHIQCNTGFTLTQTNPIVCVNTSICIDYTISGEDYSCLTCTFGYKLDVQGKCNLCDSKYVNISTNPFLCALQIENCIKHIYDGQDLICEACSEGYSMDVDGKCNECDPNYEVAYEEPLFCARRVENCARYTSDGEYWRCKACITGYMLSLDSQCDECEPGFIEVLKEPLVCVLDIEHCDELDHIGQDWVCKKCEEGYDLSMSGLCDECLPGYVKLDSENLICKKEIEHCIEDKDQYSCDKCQEGFKLVSGACICDEEKYISLENECKECPDHCTKCQQDDIKLGCSECELGFNLADTECKLDSTNTLYTTLVDNASQASKYMIFASASVSMISLNFNSILSTIGTIELLSFISIYNLNIPSRINSTLEGITVFNIVPNIFEYFIPNEDTLNIERYKRLDINNESFLINSGKILTMLMIVIVSIILLKIVNKYTARFKETSRIKRYVSKLLGILEWNFVIGYLIQVSIELTIHSLVNIYHVSFHRIESIIGFTFSVIVLVRDILDFFINISCITHNLSNKKL